jgi:heme A synthase
MRILIAALMLMTINTAAAAQSPPPALSPLTLDRAINDDELAWLPADSGMAAPDTTNQALGEMLARFNADPLATDLSYDSWTYKAHRYLGYGIFAAVATQLVLGWYTYNEERDGNEPGTIDAHRYLGYSIVGLSVMQTGLGFYNFVELRHRDAGKKKRWIHMGLSTLATAGFITAAAIANDSRGQIESGTAGVENKTFEDLYSNHRTVGILASASVALTAIVIVW